MDTLPAVLLVIGAAFGWIGLTGIVVLHLRRRRNGSTLVASAADEIEHPVRPWPARLHRNRAAARPRGMSLRRARGSGTTHQSG
ncbi:hypothetical protein [Pseudarthrobacter sp. NS4]|uniref:hypothetical protein n=1 Tax=Pseudarthrobacter sp. NS4 TaxID=2973976 RepID=UPI0021620FE4|nr:hypothetical protein [Pseudarthrobacter sp. NS4]